MFTMPSPSTASPGAATPGTASATTCTSATSASKNFEKTALCSLQDDEIARMIYYAYDAYGYPGVSSWSATRTVPYCTA